MMHSNRLLGSRWGLALFLAASSLPATDRCSSVESVWDFRDVSDPQIHPSGNSAAFVLTWNDPLSDSSYSNIWLAPFEGAPAALTQGKGRHTSPRWSPDGRSLAYVDGGKLKVRNMSTRADRLLAEGASTPTWSPDGKWIAFFRFVPAKARWAPAAPQKPAGAKWAPEAKVVTELRWTFDGQGVAAPGETRLFIVAAEGGAARQITNGDFHHGSYLHDPQAAWTADSRAL